MARILAISSQVARGHVGLSAMVPALQRLGHEVTALPTVLLSNHPGHTHVAGERIAPDVLRRMLDALAANGWLSEVDAVITGYLPTVDHVALAIEAIERVEAAAEGPLVVVDPVLGDDPKGLYIDPEVATALRDDLSPIADILTPNRFELAWLTEAEVVDPRSAVAAMSTIVNPVVVATSVPQGASALVTLLHHNGSTSSCAVRRRANVPNGTGDLFGALFVGHCLNDVSLEEALGAAIGALQALIADSVGSSELAMIGERSTWIEAAPLPVVAL